MFPLGRRCLSVNGFISATPVVDYYSRMIWLILLRKQQPIVPELRELIRRREREHVSRNLKVTQVWSDQDPSYRFHHISNIRHVSTAVGAKGQAGIMERVNGILRLDVTRMLTQSGLPQSFWDYAMSFAVFRRNSSSVTASGRDKPIIPILEYGVGRRMSPNMEATFGCDVWIRRSEHELEKEAKASKIKTSHPKLSVRGARGVFLGYDPDTFSVIAWYPGLKQHRKYDIHLCKFTLTFDTARLIAQVYRMSPNKERTLADYTSEILPQQVVDGQDVWPSLTRIAYATDPAQTQEGSLAKRIQDFKEPFTEWIEDGDILKSGAMINTASDAIEKAKMKMARKQLDILERNQEKVTDYSVDLPGLSYTRDLWSEVFNEHECCNSDMVQSGKDVGVRPCSVHSAGVTSALHHSHDAERPDHFGVQASLDHGSHSWRDWSTQMHSPMLTADRMDRQSRTVTSDLVSSRAHAELALKRDGTGRHGYQFGSACSGEDDLQDLSGMVTDSATADDAMVSADGSSVDFSCGCDDEAHTRTTQFHDPDPVMDDSDAERELEILVAEATQPETVDDVKIPKTIQEALSDSKFGMDWAKAAKVELDHIYERQVFQSIDGLNFDPEDVIRRSLHLMWVFTRKYKPSVDRIIFKARLVVRGDKQVPGLMFDETWSPVASRPNLRLLLSLCSTLGLKIQQFDVVTAFLHAVADRRLFVTAIPGIEKLCSMVSLPRLFADHKEFLLLKSLYGLKQSPRLWHDTLKKELESISYIACDQDPSIFIRKTRSYPVILLAYVDDLLLCCPPEYVQTEREDLLSINVELTDIGEMKDFLGMRIQMNDDAVVMDQSRLAAKMVKHLRPVIDDFVPKNPHKNLGACPVTPAQYKVWRTEKSTIPHTLDNRHKPQIPKWARKRVLAIQKVSGALRYLADTSRPDLCTVSLMLSSSATLARDIDFDICFTAVAYLEQTQSVTLRLPRYPLLCGDDRWDVQVFSDASHATSLHGAGVSGGAIVVNGCLLDWTAKTQARPTKSATDAELIAMFIMYEKGLFIRHLLDELLPNDVRTRRSRIIFNADNNGAIQRLTNWTYPTDPTYRKETLMLQSALVADPDNVLRYVRSEDNFADMFTKALSGPQLREQASRIGLTFSGV